MSDRELAVLTRVLTRYDTSMPRMFGSKPLMFKRPDVRAQTKRRRAFGAGDRVGCRRLARLLLLSVYIARAISA